MANMTMSSGTPMLPNIALHYVLRMIKNYSPSVTRSQYFREASLFP
jgi:hypothetical protein